MVSIYKARDFRAKKVLLEMPRVMSPFLDYFVLLWKLFYALLLQNVLPHIYAFSWGGRVCLYCVKWVLRRSCKKRMLEETGTEHCCTLLSLIRISGIKLTENVCFEVLRTDWNLGIWGWNPNPCPFRPEWASYRRAVVFHTWVIRVKVPTLEVVLHSANF